jgi:FKBP-type peptidyl-prolyl cis-trans isomerase
MGDEIWIHYVGALEPLNHATTKDVVFAQAQETPFRMVLGQGGVIEGLELGLASVCTGENLRLTVPAGDLGFSGLEDTCFTYFMLF